MSKAIVFLLQNCQIRFLYNAINNVPLNSLVVYLRDHFASICQSLWISMTSQCLGVFILKLPCFAFISNPNYQQTLKRNKAPFSFLFWLLLKNLIPFLFLFGFLLKSPIIFLPILNFLICAWHQKATRWLLS